MRRGYFFVVALTTIITFVSLQAFVGHRYYRPYAWHRSHHWNQWYGPYERYGPGWEPDSNHYRHNSWRDYRPGHLNQDNQVDSSSWR